MSRKRRHDSWDASLNEEQRWEAYEKSKQVAWYVFAKWVSEEFGTLKPSKNAVYDWQKYMRGQEGEHRLQRAILARKELRNLADAASLDEQTADAYMALANDAMLAGDPEKAAKIVEAAVKINAASLRLKEQAHHVERLELQKQELALQREKFEAQERRLTAASETVQDETLSEAERIAKIKSIFGLR